MRILRTAGGRYRRCTRCWDLSHSPRPLLRRRPAGASSWAAARVAGSTWSSCCRPRRPPSREVPHDRDAERTHPHAAGGATRDHLGRRRRRAPPLHRPGLRRRDDTRRGAPLLDAPGRGRRVPGGDAVALGLPPDGGRGPAEHDPRRGGTPPVGTVARRAPPGVRVPHPGVTARELWFHREELGGILEALERHVATARAAGMLPEPLP
jgi:hypothetical protein